MYADLSVTNLSQSCGRVPLKKTNASGFNALLEKVRNSIILSSSSSTKSLVMVKGLGKWKGVYTDSTHHLAHNVSCYFLSLFSPDGEHGFCGHLYTAHKG